MRLEAAAAGRTAAPYPARIGGNGRPYEVSFGEAVRAVAQDVRRGTAPGRISARFHATLTEAAVQAARRAERETGIRTVALGGGVFLNAVLSSGLTARLRQAGFRVLRPTLYSPNDESISLGQIGYALAKINRTGRP
jgi:hydrogenase maturation protein HypF